MNQMFLCPQCRSEVKLGERFCGNCGFTLNWQAPTQPPPTGYQNPQQQWGQQQGWQAPPQNPQQQGWQQPPQYQQQPWGYQKPYQQQYPYGGYYAQPQRRSSNTLIIFLVVLIIILFTIGGIGIATKGSFSCSSTSSTGGRQQYASIPSDSAAAQTYGEDSSPTTDIPAANASSIPETSSPTTSTTPTATATIPEISAAKIIEDFTASEAYAGSTYGGKTYIISGVVRAYSSASSPMYVNISGTTSDTLWIECYFQENSESVIESLTIGQDVKIQGKVNSYKLDQGSIIVILSKVIT